MAHPTVIKHQERLEELYHSRPLPYFTPEDLETIVGSYDPVFDGAVERKAVYPYLSVAATLLAKLTLMRNNIAKFLKPMENTPILRYDVQCDAHIFPIYVNPGDLREALQVIMPLLSQLHEHVDDLSGLEQAAEQDITYILRPNNIVGTQYLAEARFLVPVSKPTEGVYAFTLKSREDTPVLAFHAQQTTKTPYATMDLALRKETDQNRLETVVIARSTESYALSETVVPILFRRYLGEMGSQQLSRKSPPGH
ncbi:hypothetical protein HY495_02440 [Candidatus Woesearchaeota archaeon]|nr:hypothetical protein [Candidatus Woesearchaeota archaeon]